MTRFLSEIFVWGRLVKFSHTIFAMPFALAMLVVTGRYVTISLSQVLWILAALVSARTAAMAWNRLVDRHLDAQNPRTSMRELPSGLLKARSVLLLVLLSSAFFILSAAFLGYVCLLLSPFILLYLFFYSWTKRFTAYSHIVLGGALAMAPGGVWVALTGQAAILPLWLMLAVLCWVAGFDILYACQDESFDRAKRLYSFPVRFGIAASLHISQLLHSLAIICLCVFGIAAGLHWVYFTGVAVFSLLVLSQHRLVSPENLSRIDAAFFIRNGLASFLFFFFVLGDALLRIYYAG